jgi:putative endonuclease
MRTSYVYIMSNFKRNVLYVGVCDNIEKRVSQHKNNEGGHFTSKYKCHFLIYYEVFNDIALAIAREKQLKSWNRKWKLDLMKKENPYLFDLAADW